jgi:hypothetical protein
VKRSEIKTGDVLYHDSSTRWQAYPGGTRVEVLDVEHRWRNVDPWRRSGREPFEKLATHERGQGVLVEGPDAAGKPMRMVVQPAHLRGPYDETLAHVQERRRVSREHDAQMKAAREYRQEREQRIVDRAATLGIEASRSHVGYGDGRIEVEVDVFEAILDLLAEQGFQYTPREPEPASQ